jgi:dATP pyrophosphohydrolase
MPYKTPISVLVLIHTPDMQILLLERSDKPGYWQSVTGSLETGESLYDAAIREVREETGLDARRYLLSDWQMQSTYEIYPHWRHRYAPGVTHNVEHVFGLELPEPLSVNLAQEEHVRYEWVDWRDAIPRVFSWTNVIAIQALGLRQGLQL